MIFKCNVLFDPFPVSFITTADSGKEAKSDNQERRSFHDCIFNFFLL